MRRQTGDGGSRVGSFLLVVGLLTVLGTCFALGVSAGRRWPGLLPSLGSMAVRATGTATGLTAGGGLASLSRAAGGLSEAAGAATRGPSALPPSAPVLTFYRELTAPLTPPPSSGRPERNERADRGERVDRGERIERSERPERGERGARSPAPAFPAVQPELPSAIETPGRPAPVLPDRQFTVQVGAFKTREQAETMRVKLSEVGHDAYVAVLDGGPGARFRVRVGTFATRDEARHAADRLTRERQLATFVTIR